MSTLQRPVDRVVVVGAGIAGLTVAAGLRRAGIPCVVLEARDRIGGRLHTIDLAGVPVDLGGSWIHHPVGNPLRAYVDAEGLPCVPGDPLPTIAVFDAADGRMLTADERDPLLDVQFERFPAAVESLQSRLGPDATAADGIDAFLAAAGLDEAQTRRGRQLLRAEIEADAADVAERQSLRWLWHEVEYGGDLFGDLPVGGYGTVVQALATGVDVRLNHEVVAVELVDDGVRVRTADGAVEEATHVVVCTPLGVLKAGLPAFDPPLPAAKRTAIEQLGFGRYEKIALRFESAFWRDAGLSHLIVLPPEPELPAVWFFDLDDFGAGPTLVAHLFASNTGRALDAPRDEAAAWAHGLIRDAVGADIPEPVAVAVTSWSTDPHTRGAYTHVPPWADPSQLDLLGEPVAGRILFAGEHTQSERTGYADGAYSSGLREAHRLGV